MIIENDTLETLLITDINSKQSAFDSRRVREIAVKDGYAIFIERDHSGSHLSRIEVPEIALYQAFTDQGFSMIDKSAFNSGLKGDFMKVGGGNYHYIVNVMGLTSPKAPSAPAP